MAKKLQKDNKGMSPKAKFTLRKVFTGLFSNQAAIDGASNSPWWVAVIFFVFSIIIPLIPNFVSLNQAYGASFVSSLTYGLDTDLARFSLDFKLNNKEFKVADQKLHYYVENNEINLRGNESFDDYCDEITKPSSTSCVFSNVDSTTNQYTFRVYVTGLTGTKLSTYADVMAARKYRIGTTNPYDVVTDPENTKYYIPNFMILTPDTMVVALLKSNTTTMAANSKGGLNWVNSITEKGLIERAVEKVEADYTQINTQTDKDNYINTNKTVIFNAWKQVFDETYLAQKKITVRNTTLIYLGIYAGIIFFLGLMVFLLTRGKNSMFRYLNFWVCQKIAWWASASPAILGLLLGFLMAGNMIGQMGFILLVSLRIMWISMKQLRPIQQ